jgi:L-ribulose-5-phosphate 3-epimerase
MRIMQTPSLDRRGFLGAAAGLLGSSLVAGSPLSSFCVPTGLQPVRGNLFEISLAEWSLHKALFGKQISNLDFPKKAKSFGIDAIEYVNAFWKDKAKDAKYVAELKKRCSDEGVRSLLIMCDGEGALGDPDTKKRDQAVENHHQWVVAAKELGCHSIRVNAQSRGKYEEQQKLAADGLRKLCEFADPHGINVIVENHGGLSSDGKWLSSTLKMVDHKRAGALPDFGNFRVSKDTLYDRYLGVDELMPYAKGVSAKSHDFDEEGAEVHTDYQRMLDIVVVKHGWRGHIGIEYEGGKISEDEGIVATRKLLERVRTKITSRLAETEKAGK